MFRRVPLAWANLTHNPVRFAVSLAGVAFAVVLMFVQFGFRNALFDSTAFQKFEEGRKHELTFADASRFWNITENMKGEALDTRLRQFEGSLDEALAGIRGTPESAR